MKGPGIRWSTVLVVLVACGGRAAHPAEHTGGAGSGGSEAIGKVGDDQGGTGGSSATGGNAIGGERSSGGTDTSGGSANAGNSGRGGTGGSGGASGNAGNDGGGHGGAGGQGGVLMTPEALVPIANAFCGAARSCCKDPKPSPLDDCESSYGVQDPTSVALASGTITLDSAGLAACLAAYEAAAETCEQTGVLTACRGLVHGTLAEGQSCRFNSECAGDEPMVCLRPEDAKSASVCKKIVRGKAGDACVVDCYSESNSVYGQTGAICVQGAYAVSDASPTGCFEAEGNYCDVWSNSSPQCRPIRATGAACTSSDQCGSAAECDAQTHKCKAFNAACGGCPPLLQCVNGKCQGRPFTAGGTCAGASYGP